MILKLFLISFFAVTTAVAQVPPIEPGVSHDLAKWHATHYLDVRYKLNLTLEKMSPVLKGTIEIRVRVSSPHVSKGNTATAQPTTATNETATSVSEPPALAGGQKDTADPTPIILDWRRIRGSESLSTISNVSINGVSVATNWPPANAGGSDKNAALTYEESNEHLIFRDGVVFGENVIKLDFTSPILTSGSAITRYVDKEDGAEYIYSLFVPSDASTAFPVFDQPDLKARFHLDLFVPETWKVVSNTDILLSSTKPERETDEGVLVGMSHSTPIFVPKGVKLYRFFETQPISTYVFSFTAGEFAEYDERTGALATTDQPTKSASEASGAELRRVADFVRDPSRSYTRVYVRKSQAAKFKPHAAEVFRLNREGIRFLENYFDYKFPFPKYDIVLIPEFPFGGMEHAGATFLREASVIFPQEPTKNDYISRANVIFHEAAHQWFGDTVTMKWFDDLWLKEGFAEFMAYKTLEKVQGGNPTGREGAPSVKDAGQMPEVNAWKIFYERNKQAAYLTDSTKGTTPIYQEIGNLNSAKSAYGNIVYRKAPSFLKQAEFYLGEDKFQTAVRAFLKKHEFANAGWEDLVKEFERVRGKDLKNWANSWIKQRGVPTIRLARDESTDGKTYVGFSMTQRIGLDRNLSWPQTVQVFQAFRPESKPEPGNLLDYELTMYDGDRRFTEWPLQVTRSHPTISPNFVFPNYGDYGYGIFLLDDKSRDYVLKNIQSEKDDFLRTMMWGSLWDSVREGELDPKDYVELVVKNLGKSDAFTRSPAAKKTPKGVTLTTETDESTVQTLLARVSTAMRYYMAEPPALAGGQKRPQNSTNWPPADAGGSDLNARLEALLIDRMQNAPTPGLRITYYRAFLNMASSENARRIMKVILKGGNASGSERALNAPSTSVEKSTLPTGRVSASATTKDKFDIVSKLIMLGDPDALKLLAELEKTETSDEAKRYAYAARAGIATAENKAKYWNDFTANKDISESWIETALGPFNATRHADLTLPYLERALIELPNHKRSRKIFFVNGWLAGFIGGQRSEEALKIVNKFLADNPNLDKDLRLKVLENVDLIERAVRVRQKYGQ